MKNKLNCILLIDDDEPTNFLSNMLLEEAGCAHHIQIEESGQSALDYLFKSPGGINDRAGFSFPELIFLDINMPAMNGWEFLERYRELNINQQYKSVIIMITTSINPDDQLKAGAVSLIDGFENKPLTTGMIQRIMTKYFSDGHEYVGHDQNGHLIKDGNFR